MKKFIIASFAIVIFIITAGCSDSTSPNGNADVKIVGELSTPLVNAIQIIKGNNNDKIQANEVDSIKIVRIRILLSRLKLAIDSSNSATDNELKTGPFVYDINSTDDLVLLMSGNVPAGLYERIKLEFHRFNASEATQYTNDPIFKDFATTDRYSIIIEGITYMNGNPSIFEFKAQTTANLSLEFDPSLNLKEGTNTTISLQLDPNLFFKKWGSILDPNDPKNINDIENTIINTIKAVKK